MFRVLGIYNFDKTTTKIFRPQCADRGAITEPKEEGSGPLATKNRWWKIF